MGLLHRILTDTAWMGDDRRKAWRLAAVCFSILALEMVLIRWTSNQVRVLAYLNNVILIASFLGMGVGLFLGKRWPGLLHLALPSLCALTLPMAFSRQCGLLDLSFPDPSIYLWGADSDPTSWAQLLLALVLVMGILLGTVAVFLFLGAAAGALFQQLPSLRAYSFDLMGSLIGIVAVTLAVAFHTPPPVWFVIGGLPIAVLSRRPSSLLALAGVVALAWVSIEGAVFSPYYRISVTPQDGHVELRVNRDFFQDLLDLSDGYLAAVGKAPGKTELTRLRHSQRQAYDLPFTLTARRGRALILAAGTGNDVAAALRCRWEAVQAVEIDRVIFELGKDLHPESPYRDARVKPAITDARAFLEQYRGEPFDVVCYGLLDSHAMFTAMSTLRLDNFVYTEEGIRAAWKQVAPHGYLSLSFCTTGGDWTVERLFYTIRRATGVEPVMIFHRAYEGCTFLVPRPGVTLDMRVAEGFPRLRVRQPEERVRTTSDDWPFLYIRPGAVGTGYIAVLLGLLASAFFLTRWACRASGERGAFQPVFFFLGAAFMLLETRGITSFALLFGSTWVVNASVVGGVLAMALAANLLVARYRPRSIGPWFVLLMLSVAALWLLPAGSLSQLPLLERGILGGLLNACPILFSGVLFTSLLVRADHGASALASNVLGAVVGGCAEYVSMLTGLRSVLLLAALCYIVAFWLAARQQKTPAPTDY